MNTIIEITYKNYTENVIVTEANKYDVLELLTTDKDVVDYSVVVEGDIILEFVENETVCELNGGRNVGVVRALETRLNKMENKNYFTTDSEAVSHFEKIKNLSNNIKNRINQLSNLERLYV